jgi:carbonic anhydrase
MATDNIQNLVSSNEKYASSFDKGHLALPPAKKYLVSEYIPNTELIHRPWLTNVAVTCMDARIDPAAAFGINLGDAHVIRNAGGNAKDALRSILISEHLLGTREIILVKHTGCGMLTFTNTDALKVVANNVGTGVLSSTFDFQPFPGMYLEYSKCQEHRLITTMKKISRKE